MQITTTHTRPVMMRLMLLAALLCCASRAAAQEDLDTNQTKVGGYASFQLVQHDAKFAAIPGIPTCAPGFDGGSGTGFTIGALGQIRVAPAVALQARLGFASSTGTMTVQEYIGNVVEGGQVVQALVEHSIAPTLGLVEFEPGVVITPFSFPLSVQLGVGVAFPLAKSVEQKETIISPNNIVFYDGLVRNIWSVDIPDVVSPEYSVVARLGYELPLSKRLTLTPEISYHRGITKLIPDTAWNVHSLRIGAAIRFTITSPFDPDDTISITPGLTATVAASKADDGVVGAIPKMRVEEFVAPQLRPLLNYVFFDDGASSLPARYARLSPSQAARFSLESLQNMDVLPTYYNMLNVVGWRMQKNPTGTLRLVGCNSAAGSDQGKPDLSRRRAEEVRNYLRDVWAIPEGRIEIESRDLPEKPSSTSTPDGQEENRRVEMYANIPEILEPVFTIDTVLKTDPNTVRFSTTVNSEAGVHAWKLTASQGGRELKGFAGNGAVPAAIDWDVQQDRSSIPRGSQQVDYELQVTDLAGQTYVTPPSSFSVDQVTVKRKREEGMADKEINKFSLILFEYGKYDISDNNKRIIDLIRGRIAADAKVTITGHTDRAGDAAVNQRLSAERARATAKALSLPGTVAKGLGESGLLYDNALPEGRFYCRVVNVIVETSIGR